MRRSPVLESHVGDAQWEEWGNPQDPEYYDYMKVGKAYLQLDHDICGFSCTKLLRRKAKWVLRIHRATVPWTTSSGQHTPISL